MELVSIQNRYGYGISFSQLAIVRVRESIRWALIGNYVDLQLNCDSLGTLPAITQIMPAIYQHSSPRCLHIEETDPEAYDYLKFGGF